MENDNCVSALRPKLYRRQQMAVHEELKVFAVKVRRMLNTQRAREGKHAAAHNKTT